MSSLRRIRADPAPTPRREADHALALVSQDGSEPGGAGADPVGLAGLVLASAARLNSEPDGTPLPDGIAYNQRARTFDFIPHVLPG